MNTEESEKHCVVCGGTLKFWKVARDQHYGNPGTWDLFNCLDCGSRQVVPMPTEAELGAFYPQDYYSFGSHDSPSDSWKARLRRLLLPIGTKEPKHERVGRMLDLGCGSGWMVARYKELGWDALGVDYSDAAAERGRRASLNIHTGSLSSAQFEESSFDYVRSNHSFEHLNDPNAILNEISRILKPGGVLFLGVPDLAGLPPRVFGAEWYFLGAPVHVVNYSRQGLSSLLARHGYEVITVRGNSNHGSVVGSIQSIAIARKWVKGRLDGGMMSFPPTIFLGFWIAKFLDLCKQGDCVEIVARKTV